jgi:dTDP-4-amino-4,6-dideoxygalactose transaminase
MRTYVSVPMSMMHAGHKVAFNAQQWQGYYRLHPLPIFDSARFFTSNMFNIITSPGPAAVCVSFHASKTLGLEQGGAILHNLGPTADARLRRLRFDGRTEGVSPKEDTFEEIGYHCYLSPSVSAMGILKLSVLPLHNGALPNDDYPDLSKLEIFK